MTKPKEKEQKREAGPKFKSVLPEAFRIRRSPNPMADILREAETSPVQQGTPTPETPPLPQVAPAPQEPIPQTAPVTDTPSPLSQVAPAPQTAPVRQVSAGFTMVGHYVSDEVVPTLDTYSQSVLQRLLRLSWGYGKDTCKVGLPKLAEACNISVSQARRAVRLLIQRALIEILAQDGSDRDQDIRGTVYRILIPRIPARQKGATRQPSPIYQVAPAGQTPNKEKVLKERKKINAADCPDCKGEGYFFPEGPEKGIVLCKHPKL